MKGCLLLFFLISAVCSHAQDVKAYGIVTYRQNPTSKVQITLFENESVLKKTYSDRKGKFHFRLSEKKTYVLFFYKPTYNIQAYTIINRLDQDLQNIFIEVPLTKSKEVQDSVFLKSQIVKNLQPAMRDEYRLIVNEYLNEKKVKSNAGLLLKADSVAEFNRQEDGIAVHIYQTRVGSDIYERIVNFRNESRFMKNEKPITEVTYNFETKRRNDSVAKKEKKVKNHSRYKPLQK